MTTPIRLTREERERGVRRVTQITRGAALVGLAAVVGFACAAAATNPGQSTGSVPTTVVAVAQSSATTSTTTSLQATTTPTTTSSRGAVTTGGS